MPGRSNLLAWFAVETQSSGLTTSKLRRCRSVRNPTLASADVGSTRWTFWWQATESFPWEVIFFCQETHQRQQLTHRLAQAASAEWLVASGRWEAS